MSLPFISLFIPPRSLVVYCRSPWTQVAGDHVACLPSLVHRSPSPASCGTSPPSLRHPCSVPCPLHHAACHASRSMRPRSSYMLLMATTA